MAFRDGTSWVMWYLGASWVLKVAPTTASAAPPWSAASPQPPVRPTSASRQDRRFPDQDAVFTVTVSNLGATARAWL